MIDMPLTPENVSPDVFARMVTDPELRPLLGLEISDSTAETVAASPGLSAHFYERWAAQHAEVTPVQASSASSSAVADARVATADHAPVAVPLDLRRGVHALIWPAASILMIGLTLVLVIALARSDDPNLGMQAATYWTGAGYFFAIILGILGVVFGIKSIHQGLTAAGGTPRRGAAIVMGTIGLIASAWFILSWLVGWVTL